MRLKLQALEETKIYYQKELKDENLAGGEKKSYLKALEIIEGIISEEREEKQKN